MLVIAFGTRPEYLKVKPLIDELTKQKKKFKVLFTGQHTTLLNDIFEDGKDNVQYFIDIHSDEMVDRLTTLLTEISNGFSRIIKYPGFNEPPITHVLVQGDTTSALAIALAAFNNKVKVIHLEAGLRTYDHENPFPEEANRQLISRISDLHLCPTFHNQNNLDSEKVGGKKYVVGNTGLDNLTKYLDKCEYENKILVTLHRRENHDLISVWFYELNKIAVKYPDHEFILPIHPNPNVKKYSTLLTKVKVVEPLQHSDLLNLLVKCKFVITDSGGLQEECSFLGKKAIVCRKETERPEAIGITTQLCDKPDDLLAMVKELMEDYEVDNYKCPYGDGTSSKKIVKIFKDLNII